MKSLHANVRKIIIILLSVTGYLFVNTGCLRAQQFYGSGQEINEAYQYYRKGNYQQAITILQNTLASDSLQVKAYELMASAQLKLKQMAQATVTIQTGLHYFPRQQDLKWLLAETNFLSGNTEKSRKLYLDLYNRYGRNRKQISLFTKKELKIRLYQLNLMLFKHSADLHNWKDSRSFLKKAAHYEPDSLNVARDLMLTYIKEKKWSRAVSVGDSLLNHFPGNHDLIRLKAVGLYHEQKFSELLPIYKKLYEADPSDLSNALSYAELLAANGQSKESNKLYNRLLKKYPKKKEIYNSLLSINKQYHSSRGQVEVLKRMRKHFPDDQTVLDKLASIYARMDSSDTERQYYDTLLTMTHDTVKYRLKTIRSFLRDSNDSTAYQLANKLMKDYPDNRDILKTKGDLEINLKKWDNALSSYNRLKRIQDDAVVESELGKVFEALQKPDSALVHYHRAMNRETEDPFVPYRIAVLSFPNDRATSFDQSRYALSMAFKQLQKVQSRVEAQMHGNIQMSGVSSMSKQKKTLQHVDTVAKESFTFLTDHFPEKQIDPLLKNLLNSYRGSGRLYMMIAKYYMSHEKKETGLKLLKQSVHWAPQLTEAQKMLGSYYEHHGKINKAITVYQKMISLNPDDADSYDKLIDLHEQKHDLKDLCDHWLLQFRTHSDNKILQQHLIEALDKAGRYQEARKVSKMGN